MSTRLGQRVVPKTANYTVQPTYADRSGTRFTTAGAGGPVTFTLPNLGGAHVGYWCEFENHVAQTMKVQSALANTVITAGNAAATSVSASTIGAVLLAKWTGSKWTVTGLGSTTYTVA